MGGRKVRDGLISADVCELYPCNFDAGIWYAEALWLGPQVYVLFRWILANGMQSETLSFSESTFHAD
jgi:hypothetical protein